MSDVFLREFFVNIEAAVWVECCDPAASVIHVGFRRDIVGEKMQELLCLVLKDRGTPTKPTIIRHILVIPRFNDLVPLPDGCGRFLGFVQSTISHAQFYVFASSAAPLPIGSTSEETTSPPRGKEASSAGPRRDAEACSCVFDGTTLHESAASPSEQKPAEEEPPCWWEFQDAPPTYEG